MRWRKLVEVKGRVGHGRYTGFVTDRLGWSMRSGQNFVAVFDMIKSANFAPLDTLTIDASSLYLIAAGLAWYRAEEEGRTLANGQKVSDFRTAHPGIEPISDPAKHFAALYGCSQGRAV